MEVKPEELKRVEHVKLWLCGRMKQLRQLRGLTQEQVGEKMGGLIKTRISDFEHCISDYKFSTVARMAYALNVPLERVFRGCPGWSRRRLRVDPNPVVIVQADSLQKQLVDAGMSPAKSRALVAKLLDDASPPG